MSLIVRFVALYFITDVRDVIRRLPILARSVISASVIPSAKYSCSGSPERFSSGITASDAMCGTAGRVPIKRRIPPASTAIATAMAARNTAAIASHRWLLGRAGGAPSTAGSTSSAS